MFSFHCELWTTATSLQGKRVIRDSTSHMSKAGLSLFVTYINMFISIGCNNSQQTALFGEGIYLSSELHVSQLFSPTGVAWKHSRVGDRISCIAICEYVNHPDHLKCKSTGKHFYFLSIQNEILKCNFGCFSPFRWAAA